MLFDLAVPYRAIENLDSQHSIDSLNSFSMAAEEAGFYSIHVTDHPFPPKHWLESGGHQSLDPFVALAAIGSVTSRVRLRTNLVILGYRHPMIAARSASSLDVISNGRLILGLGAGYLKDEFNAVAGSYEHRGRLLDAGIQQMKSAWTGEPISLPSGASHVMRPMPVQRPHPPIWIGGNSSYARRRAVEQGQGWVPMQTSPGLARVTGTSVIANLEDLKAAIAEVKAMRDASGKSHEPFTIATRATNISGPADHPSDFIEDAICDYSDIGVDVLTLPIRSIDLRQASEEALRWGELIIDAN